LLDEHVDDIYRFLVGAVGYPDADDLFQETFLAALRAYPQLNNASNLRAWLFTIAHRKIVDAARAGRRRPQPMGAALEIADVLDSRHAPGPAEGSLVDLWGSVRELPPKQRIAVAHRFINDLAYRDIGELMGTTEEAARRNVHEALKRLREVQLT